ncbi:hypothetical protein OC835_006893 [Tilletia horrida]|nr:hypothetical protein OC835_006893 [Tilletia horrida]
MLSARTSASTLRIASAAAASAASAAAPSPAPAVGRAYATAAASTSTGAKSQPAAALASLLRTTPAAALDTPGLVFTHAAGSSAASNRHPHAPAPQTANINMCTVRTSSAFPSASSSSSSTPALRLHARNSILSTSSSSLSLSLSLSSASPARQHAAARSFSASSSSRATEVATAAAAAASSTIAASPLPPLKPVRRTFKPDRKYPQRKAFLYSAYARLLSSSNLLVLLQYGNLTVAEWNKLRADLAAIPLPPGAKANTPRAGIVAVRAALLKALLRSHPNKEVQQLSNACSGPLAFLYFPTAALVNSVASEQQGAAAQPSKAAAADANAAKEDPSKAQAAETPEKPTIDDIDPRYVERVLTVIDRAFGGKAVPAPPKDLDPFAPAATAATTLGNPRLLPLGALFYPSKSLQPDTSSKAKAKTKASSSPAVPEGFVPVPASQHPPTKLMPVLSLRAIASNVPELHELRAQMVGLLGAPAQSLVGVLSSAGGAGLVRVLKGYVAGLEKDAEQPEDKKDGGSA